MTIERISLPSGPARILDIGCGWGGMARAISISAGQIDWAKGRDRESLSTSQIDRIDYRVEDYVD